LGKKKIRGGTGKKFDSGVAEEWLANRNVGGELPFVMQRRKGQRQKREKKKTAHQNARKKKTDKKGELETQNTKGVL